MEADSHSRTTHSRTTTGRTTLGSLRQCEWALCFQWSHSGLISTTAPFTVLIQCGIAFFQPISFFPFKVLLLGLTVQFLARRKVSFLASCYDTAMQFYSHWHLRVSQTGARPGSNTPRIRGSAWKTPSSVFLFLFLDGMELDFPTDWKSFWN
jgi:hypothetical protein